MEKLCESTDFSDNGNENEINATLAEILLNDTDFSDNENEINHSLAEILLNDTVFSDQTNVQFDGPIFDVSVSKDETQEYVTSQNTDVFEFSDSDIPNGQQVRTCETNPSDISTAEFNLHCSDTKTLCDTCSQEISCSDDMFDSPPSKNEKNVICGVHFSHTFVEANKYQDSSAQGFDITKCKPLCDDSSSNELFKEDSSQGTLTDELSASESQPNKNIKKTLGSLKHKLRLTKLQRSTVPHKKMKVKLNFDSFEENLQVDDTYENCIQIDSDSEKTIEISSDCSHSSILIAQVSPARKRTIYASDSQEIITPTPKKRKVVNMKRKRLVDYSDTDDTFTSPSPCKIFNFERPVLSPESEDSDDVSYNYIV